MAMQFASKYRGCLVGGLIGDCLGAPFEGEAVISTAQINIYFNQLLNPKLKVPYKPYTDDTAMTRSLGQSLVHCKGFNGPDMAKRFTTEYFAEPKRGYGAAVHDVFCGLRLAGFEDPFYHAKKQFGGQGSFGNGAAMRIAPVSLFTHDHIEKLLEISSKTSRITHSNQLAIRGAQLQALAIRYALSLDSTDKNFDHVPFLDELINQMHELEKEDANDEFLKLDGAEDEFRRSYVKKLNTVKKFLEKDEPPSMDEIHSELGVHVAALHSVPTAIYCFLAARNPIPEIECDNQFQRCIQFAITLGGDTDTIASMAGSISGAHLGFEEIPEGLIRHCEGVDKIIQLAEDLYACTDLNRGSVKSVETALTFTYRINLSSKFGTIKFQEHMK